ncbi:MAG: riboflavin biosynthesis protein RibD [Epulopiscium sp. Nele67-Bin005]|nr:MAG: riboflavin biosynthesis protein RibD [Epulopiscium sp. Nele67-Bin005]
MKEALELAKLGVGKVNPNPLVGAVIIDEKGNIISKGYHEIYGGLHAERNAIKNCTQDLQNTTMYVTLEPCCHHGKTPPCTDAIIEAGIKKVVVGILDANPLMQGKGIKTLEDAGVEVVVGVCEKECYEINRVFFHHQKNKTPYVILKTAMTLDGKIATYTGHSKWITSANARENVHFDRNKYSAIMVGIGTVLADNPSLTCRIEGKTDTRNPIRIVCDTNLRIPLDSQLVQTANEIRTIIATSCTDKVLLEPLINQKCEVVIVQKVDEHLDLVELMKKLGKMGIDGIFLEGGSTLNFSAINAGIVQCVQAYIAPKILGGVDAKTPVGGTGFAKVSDAVELEFVKLLTFDEDNIMIEYEVKQ